MYTFGRIAYTAGNVDVMLIENGGPKMSTMWYKENQVRIVRSHIVLGAAAQWQFNSP